MSLKILAEKAMGAAAAEQRPDQSAIFLKEAQVKIAWFNGLRADNYPTLGSYQTYILVLLALVSNRFSNLLSPAQREQLSIISSALIRKVSELSPPQPPATPLRRSLNQLAYRVNNGPF